MNAPAECGTYRGWAAHRRADEESCRECKKANAVYMQRWRKRRPEMNAENAAAAAARDRALRRLGRKHADELAQLHAEELAAGRLQQEKAS